jgi:transcription-repair coupling factor (superfamily II helicase)
MFARLQCQRCGGASETEGAPDEWSPQITLGTPVLIPETYVADLGVRLGLYRRLAGLDNRREIDAFAAQLIDRFGPLPPEVENLLKIIEIKRLCHRAGIERVEAGPKGAVITLRHNRFANPAGLVDLIQKNAGTLKLRTDQKLVYLRNWQDEKTRLDGVTKLLTAFARLARTTPPADTPMPPPTPELVKTRAAKRA